ncbi:MAG: Ig-like domain-containing protein, partial [Hellea sp.]
DILVDRSLDEPAIALANDTGTVDDFISNDGKVSVDVNWSLQEWSGDFTYEHNIFTNIDDYSGYVGSNIENGEVYAGVAYVIQDSNEILTQGYRVNVETGAIYLSNRAGSPTWYQSQIGERNNSLVEGTIEVTGIRGNGETDTVSVEMIVDDPTRDIAFSGSDYTFLVREDADDEDVLGITTATTYRNYDPISYAITAGNELGYYEIDPQTGQVSLTSSGAASLQSDVDINSTLVVTATNTDDSTNTNVTVNMYVGDGSEELTFTSSSYTFYIPDNTTNNANIIGFVNAPNAIEIEALLESWSYRILDLGVDPESASEEDWSEWTLYGGFGEDDLPIPITQTSFDLSDNVDDLTDTHFVLSDGTYLPGSIEVRQTDLAGNVTVTTNTETWIIDSQAPVAPSISLFSDSGISGEDSITNDATVTVGGLELGAVWEYTLDGGTTWITGTGTSFELADDTEYLANDIQIRQTDEAGNTSPVANLSATTTDMDAPIVTSTAPEDESTNVVVDSIINLVFDESVIAGSGNITITDGASDIRTIAVDDAQIVIEDEVVTINLTDDLNEATEYTVQISDGVFTDVAGNAIIANNNVFNFTTESTTASQLYFTVDSSGVFLDKDEDGYYSGEDVYISSHDGADSNDTLEYLVARSNLFTGDSVDITNSNITLRVTTKSMDPIDIAGFGDDDLLIIDVVTNTDLTSSSGYIMDLIYSSQPFSLTKTKTNVRNYDLNGTQFGQNMFNFNVYTFQTITSSVRLKWSYEGHPSNPNVNSGTFVYWGTTSSTNTIIGNFETQGSITSNGGYANSTEGGNTGIQIVFPDIEIPS